MQTIQETIEQLHGVLRDYIEATYHISARSLIARRKDLLDCPSVIHQVPYWNQRRVTRRAKDLPT